jgi:hypothetical protein
MLRKLACATVLLFLCIGITLGEEIRAIILKVDGNNVTFVANKGKGQKGPEQTLPVAENVKVSKGKFNQETKKVDAGEPLDGGLKNEAFSSEKLEKGVRATVVTDDENKKITEIRLMPARKKKN